MNQPIVKQPLLHLAGLAIILSMSMSCGKTPDKPKYTAADSVLIFVKESMDAMYLWQDQMTRVQWKDYTDPAEMMDDMIYKPVDRWSNVYAKSSLKSFFSGESIGYGFMPDWDGNYLMAASVYSSSEAYQKGLRRGYRITSVNGRNPSGIRDWDFFNSPALGESLRIVAVSPADTLQMTITAVSVVADNVLYQEVILANGAACGYIVYESFTEKSKDAVIAAMEDFRVMGVSELIIDLRYNGGGETSVLVDWMSKIVPARLSGKPFFITKHNSKAAHLNKVDKVFPNAQSLGAERVFVITSQRTASASEALISCLSPYIEVHQIGETTHGKPVGMYVYEFKDWYVVPISFEYTNALGEGGFYSGIQPEQYAYDDKSYDWGDTRDPGLAQALHYIKYGSYSSNIIATRLKHSPKPVVPQPAIGLYTRAHVQDGR